MISRGDIFLSLHGSWSPAILGGSFVLFLVVGFLYLQGSKVKYRLPPGPKGSPIIGNLWQMPVERSEIQFAKWAKEYDSDIIYLSLLGQPVIVLNSLKSAVDLLDRKGAIYSDRPPMVVLNALGFVNNVVLLHDGAQYRKLRKVYGNFLSASNSLAYRNIQLKHAREMLIEIEKCPDKWQSYLSRFATRVIFSMGFAIDVEDEDDPYFTLAEQMGSIISNMGSNGITILDVAPWVQHVPRWIGKYIPSVKYVHDHRSTISEFHQRPFDQVMKNFDDGVLKPSFLGRLIEARESQKFDPDEATKSFTNAELKGTGGTIYAAGQDTTFATETIFVMGMVLAPAVQARAQKEIDNLTGGKRLPTFDDWKLLPIVERIVYEALRFHPVVPSGVPHRTTKDDVYRDMFIPKGKYSMVLANAWAMLHDPEIYRDPFTFNPDRFLPVSEGGAEEPLPQGHFGFGRRVCPGQFLGFASIWIVVATILAKFDISPTKDDDGKDIMPDMEFSSGITSHPAPFDCVFTPRNSL